MKRVLFCLRMPRGTYCGGISVIIKQYLENAVQFETYGVRVSLFDEAECKVRWKTPWRKLNNIIDLFAQMRALKAKLACETDTNIHIHTSRGWTLLKDLVLVRSVRKMVKEKIIMSIHFADQDKILMQHPLIKKFELSVINNMVDEVIFLSKKTRDDFIKTGLSPERAKLLYTFHNFTAISNEKPRNSCRSQAIRLLFVGSIDRRKGILDLMETLCGIKEFSYTLDICGQISEESIRERYEQLKLQLGQHVTEHGYVTGEKKRTLFENADVLVLPSYGEGMPIVIMEAMAASCAIISTTVGAIPEIVHEEHGILIEPGDGGALKQAIEELVLNFERLESMKKINEKAGKEFSLEANIKKLCEIYCATQGAQDSDNGI